MMKIRGDEPPIKLPQMNESLGPRFLGPHGPTAPTLPQLSDLSKLPFNALAQINAQVLSNPMAYSQLTNNTQVYFNFFSYTFLFFLNIFKKTILQQRTNSLRLLLKMNSK